MIPTCQDCGKKLNPSSKRDTKRCRVCWLESSSTRFGPVDVDDAFGHWLAGFVDGEGNFQAHNRGDGAGGFVFRIILREDDKPVLDEIRLRLGVGVLYYRDLLKNKHNWNPKYQATAITNQWAYLVQPMVDLINVIVPLFDKYPLRAKKKIQYAEWRSSLMKSRGASRLLERKSV